MKNELDCGAARKQLVEGARRRTEPDAALSAHLQSCAGCRERLESERKLTAALRQVRLRTGAARSPEAARRALLGEFEARRCKSAGRRWLWSVAAAAVLLISTAAVWDLTKAPVVHESATAAAEEPLEAQEEGFIEVPYTPPLGLGERVRVVHTELQPAALASLGVNVDPGWAAALPADLLLGEDGFPRAVRVASEVADESAF